LKPSACRVVYQEREFNCVNKYVECDYCGRES
jgi:hypothetical protein